MATATSLQLVNKILGTLTTDLSGASKETWKAIVPVYQVDAIQGLVYGLVGLGILGACVFLMKYLFFSLRKTRSLGRGEKRSSFLFDCDGDPELLWVMLMIVGVAGASISSMIAFINLVDIWNWVALWHPQAYAVHELLRHTLSSK